MMGQLVWFMTALLNGFNKIRNALEKVWLSYVKKRTSADKLIKPVLLAYASHDAAMSSEAAFNFLNESQTYIQQGAIWALGRVVPTEDERLLNRAIDRLDEIIEISDSDNDTAHAIEAVLQLLRRTDGTILQTVEPLLIKTCEASSPATCYALASGLLVHHKMYSQTMVDSTFSALQHIDNSDLHTIKTIDLILYQWDLDGDRQRVFELLSNLLGRPDDAIELDALDSFKNKLRNEQDVVLGWYVVSLLLTGNSKLCLAAAQLLPYNKGLDIDLRSFSLTSPWVLYLARKILGYCLVNKESTAALLLSCVRVIPDTERTELENLIQDYFLMNYMTAIDLFKAALFPNDPAKQSVARLSQALKSYTDKLKQVGKCPAFSPTERERQLESYRLGNLARDAQKKAEANSIFFSLAHKATLLYGTASIAYIQRDDQDNLDRQEITMKRYEQDIEFPRMEVIDPVGLHYALYRFQTESPPS